MSINTKQNGSLKKIANYGMDALEVIITKLFKNADEQSFPMSSNSDEGLNLLKNVSISTPSNGQVLKYNSTSQKWENANESPNEMRCDKTVAGTYTLSATVDAQGNVTYTWS